jgi:hypothetical protein
LGSFGSCHAKIRNWQTDAIKQSRLVLTNSDVFYLLAQIDRNWLDYLDLLLILSQDVLAYGETRLPHGQSHYFVLAVILTFKRKTRTKWHSSMKGLLRLREYTMPKIQKAYSHPSPPAQFKSDLKSFVRKFKKFHCLDYMEAREVCLAILGFPDPYNFTKWIKQREDLFHEHESMRLSCLMSKPQEYNEGFYLFESQLDFYAIDRKSNDITEGLRVTELEEQLRWDLESFSENQYYLTFDTKFYSPICNIWVENVGINYIEVREASCSCRSSYLFDRKRFLEKDYEIYEIKNVDQLHSWSTIWGGACFFDEYVAEEFKNKFPKLATRLFSPYSVLSQNKKYV